MHIYIYMYFLFHIYIYIYIYVFMNIYILLYLSFYLSIYLSIHIGLKGTLDGVGAPALERRDARALCHAHHHPGGLRCHRLGFTTRIILYH